MRSVYLSGLSPRFQGLSRSSWAGCLRITHPFASISVQQAGLLSIDLHVLGTPPAFILSQDQTLHLISSSIVTASRCLSCINLLTFVVSCNVSISCSVFKELPHCPFEQCSMSISSSRFLCQHVFCFFLCFFCFCLQIQRLCTSFNQAKEKDKNKIIFQITFISYLFSFSYIVFSHSRILEIPHLDLISLSLE